MRFDTVRIAGAGVAGLGTAIALARGGARVELYERRTASAAPRPPRWDAVENWSTGPDLRQVLGACGIDAGPFHPPARIDVRTFDGEPHPIDPVRPLLLVVQRGDSVGSLDAALETQARQLGVRIHRGAALRMEQADVWATGTPGRGVFLDACLTFRTTLEDQLTILVDPALAPRACAYLIARDGMATLAVLLTRGFADVRARLAEAVGAFQRMQPFPIDAPRLRSGFGGVPALFASQGTRPLRVGEAGGLLDYLWGFGIRHALASGVLAARALLDRRDYAHLLEAELAPLVRASLLNRRLCNLAGRHLSRALVRHVCASPDPRALLHRAYRPRRLRRWFGSWTTPTFARTLP